MSRIFDGWLLYLPDPAEYGRQASAITPAGSRKTAITPGLYVTVLPEEDSRGLEEYVQAYYGATVAQMKARQAFVSGTIDECVARLRQYVEAGARHIIIRVGSLHVMPHLDAITEIRHRLTSLAH